MLWLFILSPVRFVRVQFYTLHRCAQFTHTAHRTRTSAHLHHHHGNDVRAHVRTEQTQPCSHSFPPTPSERPNTLRMCVCTLDASSSPSSSFTRISRVRCVAFRCTPCNQRLATRSCVIYVCLVVSPEAAIRLSPVARRTLPLEGLTC